MTPERAANLGRALSFSLLAPMQFFYGLWIGQFQTPYVFLVILLTGYSFAIMASSLMHDTVVLSLYIMALFFIFVILVTKMFYSSSSRNKGQ